MACMFAISGQRLYDIRCHACASSNHIDIINIAAPDGS